MPSVDEKTLIHLPAPRLPLTNPSNNKKNPPVKTAKTNPQQLQRRGPDIDPDPPAVRIERAGDRVLCG